jgi:hypothetical protein
MHLIILGSLPPSNVAPDLAPHLEERCPALTMRLEKLFASETACPPEETGCSVPEYLELLALGYPQRTSQHLGDGFGPLRAGITAPNEPVWIADLCSVAIGREGAKLAIPESLQLDAQDADTLFDAVKPLWSDSEISALPIGLGRWRVWLDQSAQLTSITPAAASLLSVSDWWPQDASMKAWRKLLNEIQMVWHHHPVNQQRMERGLEPINSLWLYGGAPGWKPQPLAVPSTYYRDLTKPFLESDWALWIEQLPALSRYLENLPPDTKITLTGERRSITLTAPQSRWWQFLLRPRTQNWMKWWTHQN